MICGTLVPTQPGADEMDVPPISLIGIALYSISFSMHLVGRLDGNGFVNFNVNLVGASFVLISLMEYYHLSSVLSKISWIAISVV